MRLIDAPPNKNEISADYIKHYTKKEGTNKTLSHPYSEILVINKGDVIYTARGKVLRLIDRSIIYNRQGSIHNNFVQESRLYERFRIKFYEEDVLSGETDATLIKTALAASFAKELYEDDFSLIWELAKGINRLNSRSELSQTEKAQRTKSLALIILNSSLAKDKYTLHSESYIIDVIEYLNKNLGNKLTIEKIAENFFVSRGKLIHDFKKYCNLSINDYITMERLEKSKLLLKNGFSVSTVANECGFSSSSYFIKVFSSAIGITPLKYQINHPSF